MKKNELYILTNQYMELSKNEIKNNEKDKNKLSYVSITEDNKAYFENEYNIICKNKLKEKNLIKNELNNIGKTMSWLRNFKKDIQIESNKTTDEEKKKEEMRKKIENNIINSFFTKRMKIKDPVFQINQTSSFPMIAGDKKLLSDLWKKDMMKYYKHIVENNRIKNKKFLSDLLDVYD